MTTEIDDLKEATRHAHEAIKDLRLVIREAQEVAEGVRQLIHDEVHTRINTVVEAGLTDYKAALMQAIDEATDKVMHRFDDLAELLMGEDKQSKRKGLKTIPEYIEEIGGARS